MALAVRSISSATSTLRAATGPASGELHAHNSRWERYSALTFKNPQTKLSTAS